ncbi:hypothetical protein KKB01_05490, partial [bacterium]|nr:hypothetical protein [bacterium]
GYLDYPHYTRPDEFKGLKVPDILLSGNHKEIEEWRRKQSLLRTLIRRPEIFVNKKLSKRELDLLKELEKCFKEDYGKKTGKTENKNIKKLCSPGREEGA